MRYKGDNDTLYIWEAVGHIFNKKKVYKIGVTSNRLGHSRILAVAKKAGIEPKILFFHRTNNRATLTEVKMHRIGEDPGYEGFPGVTEFRALTESELEQLIEIGSKA